MTSAQRVVLFLLGASLLAGVVWGSPFFYRLVYVWAFLYAGSWVLSRLSLRGVTIQRSARTTRSQVGQIFEERFELINRSRVPKLWIEIRDESPLPGSHSSQVLSMIKGRRAGRTWCAHDFSAEVSIH